MQPWLSWVQLDSPLELPEGCLNLLALEICLAEICMSFHKARIYLRRSPKSGKGTIKVPGFF
jgi:hypothetical protein